MAADARSIDATPIRIVIVSMDAHLAGPIAAAQASMRLRAPNLSIELLSAADWENDPAAAAAASESILKADILVAGMLFMEQQVRPILPALEKRAKGSGSSGWTSPSPARSLS